MLHICLDRWHVKAEGVLGTISHNFHSEKSNMKSASALWTIRRKSATFAVMKTSRRAGNSLFN